MELKAGEFEADRRLDLCEDTYLASSCGGISPAFFILSGCLSLVFWLLARQKSFLRLTSVPGVVFCRDSLGLFVGDVCKDVFPVAGLEAFAQFFVFEFDTFKKNQTVYLV